MNSKKLIGTAFAAVTAIALCIIGAVATAPSFAWLIVMLGSKGTVRMQPAGASLMAADDKVGFCLEYARQLTEAGYGYSLIVIAGTIAAACVAVAAYSRTRNPKRDVANGVLGSQTVVSGRLPLLAKCRKWDGKEVPDHAGVVLGTVAGRSIVFECVHAAVCAPSGSMKTRGSVYPTADCLSAKGDSNLLFTDPSMEIYATASGCLAERGYSVRLLDLESPRQGGRFNPLRLIRDLHEAGDEAAAIERAREVGGTLYPTSGGENDIFARAAGGVFSAVAYAVATGEGVPDGQRHIWSVAKTVMAGTIDGSEPLKDWLRGFGADSAVVSMSSTFLSSSGKMESSILSSLNDGLQPFTSPNMRWLTSGDEIDVDEMIEGKSATFVHTLGPGAAANRIAALFLAQHWAETQRLGRRRGLRPFWVIADEFHSIPRFDLVHALEQSRKYGLHYVMYVQSFSGFDQYRTQKEDGKDAILANCDVKALYRAGNEQDARYFEALGGFKTVRVKNEGEQRSGMSQGSTSTGYSEQKVPLWPQASLLARNPATDGALVFQSAQGGRDAGKYEVPIVDPSRTFTAEHFQTLGNVDFEKESMGRIFDLLEEKASRISLEVEGWTPDFEANKDDDKAKSAVEADEFDAWD